MMSSRKKRAEKELNVKLTREDGTDYYSGTILYGVGKTVIAPDWLPIFDCGCGLHFGTAKAALLNTSPNPARAFEVKPIGEVIKVGPGKMKVQRLTVMRELDFPKLLSELAKDGSLSISVRVAVARNSKTPTRVLSKLAKDESEYIRARVADNFNTSKKVLSELAKDVNEDVRERVVRNYNTPKKTIIELSNDKDLYIRRKAVKVLQAKEI